MDIDSKTFHGMVIRPIGIKGEKYFLILEKDFFDLVRDTQYKHTVFSTTDGYVPKTASEEDFFG